MNDTIKISEIWYSEDEKKWSDALNKYNDIVDDQKLEEEMDDVNPAEVKTMNFNSFYSFLKRYYKWKYQKNYLNKRLEDLKKHESDEDKLMKIRDRIFALYDQDKENTEKLIEEVKQISGLGVPGASGLLSILFPEDYGTVDKFLVISLCLVDGLDEHDKLLKIDESNIKTKDAVLLERIIRDKAKELNDRFKPDAKDKWTPKKLDKVLWAYRDEQQTAYYKIEQAIVKKGAELSKEEKKRLSERIMNI